MLDFPALRGRGYPWTNDDVETLCKIYHANKSQPAFIIDTKAAMALKRTIRACEQKRQLLKLNTRHNATKFWTVERNQKMANLIKSFTPFCCRKHLDHMLARHLDTTPAACAVQRRKLQLIPEKKWKRGYHSCSRKRACDK